MKLGKYTVPTGNRTPIYCPLRRTWSLVNGPFPSGIEPRAIAWQCITLPLRHASSTIATLERLEKCVAFKLGKALIINCHVVVRWWCVSGWPGTWVPVDVDSGSGTGNSPPTVGWLCRLLSCFSCWHSRCSLQHKDWVLITLSCYARKNNFITSYIV